MSTTSLIVEILVIGVLATVWIVLTLVRLSVPVDPIVAACARIGPLYVLVATAVIYQIGWMVNGLAHAVVSVCFDKRVRDAFFSQECLLYESVRATVYQRASTDLRADLGADRSVIRLSRASALNLILIAVVLATFGYEWIPLSALALLCAIGSAVQWFFRYRRYYRRMLSAYKAILCLGPPADATPMRST